MQVPYEMRECTFFKSVAEYEQVVAARYGQRNAKINSTSTNNFEDGYGQRHEKMKATSTNYLDDGKIDRLLKLVEWLLLTCVVIAIVAIVGVMTMLVK